MRHSEAKQIVTRNFQAVAGRAPSDSEAAYCQAVAWLETFYGRGGQFAALFAQGHVNWGALETTAQGGVCPPGTLSGTDVGSVCFYVFDTDDSACQTFLQVLLTGKRGPGGAVKPAMLAAMTGSPTDVAQAMKDAGYFSADVSAYANAIATSLQVNAGSGGITDQGKVFTTADPPAGTPPQTPATPGAKPGATGLMAKLSGLSTPAKLALGLGAAAAAAFAVKRTLL